MHDRLWLCSAVSLFIFMGGCDAQQPTPAEKSGRTILATSTEQAERVSFVAIGDQGTGDGNQRSVADHLEQILNARAGVQFGVFLGDNFYVDGVSSVVDPLWESTFEEVYVGEHLSGLPFYAVLGNHDIRESAEAQIEYSEMHLGTNRWRMPDRHYAVNFGRQKECETCPLVRLVAIETTQDEASLKVQANFIKSSFAASTAKWHIVMGHHPIRTLGKYADKFATRNALLDALKNSGVHLYLSGHDHNQQVIYHADEPLYLVNGNGGNKIYPVEKGSKELLFSSEEFGFSIITADQEKITIDTFGLDESTTSTTTIETKENTSKISAKINTNT